MEKALSKYAVTLGKWNKYWFDDMEMNRLYLRGLEQYYNDVFKINGYLFLRDIYDRLGVPITKESIVCGWFYDENNQFVDNRVEFDITETDNGCIVIDFNVDGNILDKF